MSDIIPSLNNINESIDNLVHWGTVAAYAIIAIAVIIVIWVVYKAIKCGCCLVSCITCPCRKACAKASESYTDENERRQLLRY